MYVNSAFDLYFSGREQVKVLNISLINIQGLIHCLLWMKHDFYDTSFLDVVW
jgi:hypothetical protein